MKFICDHMDTENPELTGVEKLEIQPLLTVEDAWDLFSREIRPEFLTHLQLNNVQSRILSDLLVVLDGLPMAIIKFAHALNSMKKNSLSRKWKGALVYIPLDQEGTDPQKAEMFNRFTVSYKNLKEKTQRCFLYCALYPGGHLIETKELIEYWIWEDLLGTGADQTLEDAADEGEEILEELVNAHLLQSTSTALTDKRSVKMPRLVHAMVAGTIAKEKRRVCLRSGGSLVYLPTSASDWNSEAKRASFMINKLKILDLKENLNCSKLSTLLLQDNPLDLGVEENLFSSTPNLKVLDMSRTKISSLPNTLSDLGKLRALLLRNCANLNGVPDLSNLQQVIVLDFSGTPLHSCPGGIQNMAKLRRLNLSQTKIANFPAKIVSQLINLEELLMFTDDGCEWGSIVCIQWKWACIEELQELSKLAFLQLHLLNTEVFNRYLKMAKQHPNLVPPKFNIRVGVVQPGEYAKGNSLAVSGLSIDSCTPKISKAELNITSLLQLSSLNVLDVSNFASLSYLFSAEILESLTELRELRVRSCKEMVGIVLEPAKKGTIIHVRHLRKMAFFELPRLTNICCGQTLDCPELVSVRVWDCSNLELPDFTGLDAAA